MTRISPDIEELARRFLTQDTRERRKENGLASRGHLKVGRRTRRGLNRPTSQVTLPLRRLASRAMADFYGGVRPRRHCSDRGLRRDLVVGGGLPTGGDVAPGASRSTSARAISASSDAQS